jgi:DNA-binding transcriptional LysR family regulator
VIVFSMTGHVFETKIGCTLRQRRNGTVAMADLNSLAIFAKVVEANSFSKAAHWLNMPVSTISRRVAELEDQLGVRLIERSTRRLRLTYIGAEVLEHARSSAELREVIDGLLLNKKAGLSGIVRLSIPPNITDTLIAPTVADFQRVHPKVRIQISVAAHVVDHVADGADLAIRIGPIDDPALTQRKVLTYRHQLVASPSYLDGHEAPRTPQDLLEHRLIAFSCLQPETHWTFFHGNGVDKETVRFRPYMSMNDFSGLTTALLAGAGIGDLPPVVIPALLAEGRLVEVMPEWHFSRFDLSMAYPAGRHLTRATQVFMEFACDTIPALFPSLPA